MTYAEFEQAGWESMPPIRRRVCGRERFNELLALTIRNWSPDYIDACHDDVHRRRYARELLDRVRHDHQQITGMGQQEYGFIWVFLLCAVASAVIQWLVKRWLDNHFNRDMLQAWQREVAS